MESKECIEHAPSHRLTDISDLPSLFRSDVLSFYKEEIAGDVGNHISLLARRQGVSKMMAFQQLADKAVKSAAQVSKILEADKEAHDAWQHFKAGYLGNHASLEGRYRLAELMNGLEV